MGAKEIERSTEAPFPFSYVEEHLRKRHFGILGTVSSDGHPHAAGVVYAMPLEDQQPFCLYLISRPVLKKVRNIRSNPHVSFVVPFPHYLFRMVPPACIQFQAKAEIVSINDQIAAKAFDSSIVLRRSMTHSKVLGESVFIRLIPDRKIFCFGIGANIWQYLIQSKNKALGNFHVFVPHGRQLL